jgi:hypothetical protein
MTAPPQHEQALALANEIRRGVRAFVRETRALPRREAANVLADAFELDYEDRILGAARVRFLLTAPPNLYERSVEKLLALASCAKNADVRLRDLTPRQRTIIATQLRLWGEGVAVGS